MKKAKYITGAMLFFITCLLIGEFFVWHISSFYSSFPSTTLYLQEGQEKNELVNDVIRAAEDTGIEAFAVKTRLNNSFSVTIDVYGTTNLAEYLAKNSNVYSGCFQSVFLGNVTVSISSLQELPEDFTPDRFFLAGDHESNTHFKQQLINKYAGNFPRPVNTADHNVYLIIGVWLVVFFLLLLLSNYDIALTKREVIVRMVSGEPLTNFVGTSILKDTLYFTGIFVSVFLFASIFTVTTYHFAITLILFFAFILINAILHLSLLKTDFRRDTGSIQSAKKVLKLSYVYKCAAIAISIFIMTSNIALIKDGLSCYKQQEFFNQHKYYYYVNFSFLTNNEEHSTTNAIDLLSTHSSHSLVDLQSWDMGVEYVYSDGGSVELLESTIPELKAKRLDSKVYFLMPSHLSSDPLILNDALDIWTAYYDGTFEYEVIPCRKTTTIAINSAENISSSIKENPIIIINNLGPGSYESFSNIGYISECTMFALDNADLLSLADSGCINYATNVYEHYAFSLAAAKRNMIAGLLFLLMVLSINTIISRSMVYYDCKINAIEYCLKRITGYSLISIYGLTFAPTLLVSFIATLISSVYVVMTNSSDLLSVVAGYIMIVIIDAVFMLHYLHITKRIGMTKVFKGGSI